MQPTEKIVSRPNAQLFTQSTGEPVNGTILLLMGATASLAWWPPAFIEALAAAGYRVICYDNRDTGRSTLSSPGPLAYDVPDLVDDAIAILDAHGVTSAHLVGMSLGGLVAQLLALQHPERIETVTLYAAEPLGNDYEGAGMPAEMMDHFGKLATLDWTDRDTVAAFLRRIAELSAAPDRPADRAAALERINRELDHAASMQHAFNHAMLTGNVDPSLKVQDITQPVLVIHGRGDPLIAVAAAEKTSRLLPRAKLVVLDAVGHEFTPAEVAPIAHAVIDFLSSM